MTATHDALEEYEGQLRQLLARIGTVDPASAGFQAVLADGARSAAGLARALARLEQASDAERAEVRGQLVRLTEWNALVQGAVRHEQENVLGLLAKSRLVRQSLGQSIQPVETGDSCDVRG